MSNVVKRKLSMKLGLNPTARAVAQALAAIAVAGCGGGSHDGPAMGARSEGATGGRTAQVAELSAWTLLAAEGQSFSVSGTQTVRYGSGTSWIEKSVTGSGEGHAHGQ